MTNFETYSAQWCETLDEVTGSADIFHTLFQCSHLPWRGLIYFVLFAVSRNAWHSVQLVLLLTSFTGRSAAYWTRNPTAIRWKCRFIATRLRLVIRRWRSPTMKKRVSFASTRLASVWDHSQRVCQLNGCNTFSIPCCWNLFVKCLLIEALHFSQKMVFYVLR